MNPTRIVDYTQTGVLVLLGLLLAASIVLSLGWRPQHDTPLLHYVAFLIDRHAFVPYRDVFETSMPGTIMIHLAIGNLLGYSDAAFRVVDIVCLAVLLTTTWLLMRPLGVAVAFAGVFSFGLVYLGFGPAMSLQRDYLGIVPIAIALLFATRNFGSPVTTGKAAVIGALFALSASIKPQLAVGLPAVIVYLCSHRNSDDRAGRLAFALRVFKASLAAAVGFALAAAVPFIWLWAAGGFASFQEMFFSYLPLHLELSGDHRVVSGPARWSHMLESYRYMGGLGALSVLAVLSVGRASWALHDRAKLGFIVLLTALCVLYAAYPALSGQFWDYHWMPFAYFVTLCASLVLMRMSQRAYSAAGRVAALVVLTVCLAHAKSSEGLARRLLGNSPASLKDDRVDAIAGFLRTHLRPGDTVQPLDWTGGAVHGMLAAEAVVATPYIYDYHFYHHVSNPYIQTLRERFLDRLKAALPRFIIEVSAKPGPQGPGTTTEFEALHSFTDSHYMPVHAGQGFRILERMLR